MRSVRIFLVAGLLLGALSPWFVSCAGKAVSVTMPDVKPQADEPLLMPEIVASAEPVIPTIPEIVATAEPVIQLMSEVVVTAERPAPAEQSEASGMSRGETGGGYSHSPSTEMRAGYVFRAAPKTSQLARPLQLSD